MESRIRRPRKFSRSAAKVAAHFLSRRQVELARQSIGSRGAAKFDYGVSKSGSPVHRHDRADARHEACLLSGPSRRGHCDRRPSRRPHRARRIVPGWATPWPSPIFSATARSRSPPAGASPTPTRKWASSCTTRRMPHVEQMVVRLDRRQRHGHRRPAAADLDGDGRPEIIAAGRDTHNLKIYWNRPAT